MSLGTEALKSFVCETLAEPWRDVSIGMADSDINDRKGSYKLGEVWKEAYDVFNVRLLTIDVQMGYLVFVDRHFIIGGASRLVNACKFLDFDVAREYQNANKILDGCVWVDWPYRPGDVQRACAKYGWRAVLGDDAKDFGVMHKAGGKSKPVRLFFKAVTIYVAEGTKGGRTGELERISFAKFHYQEMLYLHLMRGLGAIWELPDDIPGAYVDQLTCTKCFEVTDANGVVHREFRDLDRHDFGSCEIIATVAADAAGIFGE